MIQYAWIALHKTHIPENYMIKPDIPLQDTQTGEKAGLNSGKRSCKQYNLSTIPVVEQISSKTYRNHHKQPYGSINPE